MIRFICKTILHSTNGYNAVKPQNPSMVFALSPLIKQFSSDNAHNFTVSYLTKTCGLSPESALSASKIVRFESCEQPDSVISCFQKFGFSKTQIFAMIEKFPKTLSCDPGKTITPKVEFFRSRGVSTPDIVNIFTLNPWILGRSLENKLVHTCNVLIKLFQSEDKAIELIKRNPWILDKTPEDSLIPNIRTLRENGVYPSKILHIIGCNWRCIQTNPAKFEKIVEEVKEMGFNPLKSQFVDAITLLTGLSKSTRDGKVEVYKGWGWSDKDFTTAFKKYPRCMMYSNDKIMAMMDFYINKLGLESSVIVNYPLLLGYSLKKRIIPRSAVIEFLSSKGLVRLDSSISKLFVCPEKRFLDKYAETPHLKKLYKEKLLEMSDTRQSANVEEWRKNGKWFRVN